jgi:predicted  nucleic acid-binding Zn-ribbon protein
MVELEKIYRKQRNNREILPKLLDILEKRAAQIDERVSQLVALKKEIREYQQRLRNKVLLGATHEEPGTTGKEMQP